MENDDLAEEIWKDIPGFEGIYQASTFGKIKSLAKIVNHFKGGKRKVKERIFKVYINVHGYQIVTFYKDGKQFSKKVHRLIAKTFKDNPENKPYVNHIDGDKTNNYENNVEWSTAKENIDHSWKMGLSVYSEKARKAVSEICKKRVGSKNPVSKLTEKEVLEIRKIGRTLPQVFQY